MCVYFIYIVLFHVYCVFFLFFVLVYEFLCGLWLLLPLVLFCYKKFVRYFATYFSILAHPDIYYIYDVHDIYCVFFILAQLDMYDILFAFVFYVYYANFYALLWFLWVLGWIVFFWVKIAVLLVLPLFYLSFDKG